MGNGPTQASETGEQHAWAPRRGAAMVVRGAAFGVPLLVGLLAGHLASPALARPGGVLGLVAFVAQVSVVSTAAATCTDRFTRRLLPLASLFRMSLVFPDEAPSRFKAALRAGSSKRLEADLRRLRSARPGDLANGEAAELLLAMLGQLGRHERLTRGHTERVRAYVDLIAQELGLAKEDRDLLRWGALAHDLGKLAVPAEILNKNGRPTDEEWDILRTHPEVGAQLVEPLAEWLGDWRLAASDHHERFDGGGYPRGLHGDEISLAGRIVAVADAYDVMTSTRSYKKPSTPEKARRELVRCAGTQFDPDVVRAMLNVSLGKLRLAGGPLGALGELPLVGRVATPVQMVSSGSVTAVAALTTAAISIVAPQAVPADDVVHAAAVSTVEGDAPVASSGDPAPWTTMGRATDTSAENGAVGGAATGPGNPTAPVDGLQTAPSTTVAGATPTTTTGDAGPPPAVASPRPTNGADPPTTAPRADDPAPDPDPPASRAPATTVAPIGDPAPSPPAPTTARPSSSWAVDDEAAVRDDHDEKIFVLDNDASVSGTIDPATLTIVRPPAHAKDVKVHDGHLHYRSIKNYVGIDTITYRVCDTSGTCSTATVTITVTP